MKLRIFFAHCSAHAVWFLLGSASAQVQSGPDIVWATNDHYSAVRSIAFSQDSARLASGSEGYSIKVWDVASGVVVRTLGLPQERVLAVALSPDGSQIVGGSDEDHVRLWNVADGFRLWGGEGGSANRVNSLAFSHDGKSLVRTRGQEVSLRPNGELFVLTNIVVPQGIRLDGEESIPAIFSASFSPDDTLVASGGLDQLAKLWRVSDRALVRTFAGHSNSVFSVDISPDGVTLLTTSADGTARLWRLSDATMLRIIDGGGGPVGRFGADGKTFFTSSGTGLLNYWNTANGRLLATYSISGDAITVAANGEFFAYGRYDGGVVLARMPLWIETVSQSNSVITLRWQGGTGNYQVQARDSLSTGAWQNLGTPTTNTVFTHTCLSPMFYRVQSLTNAP